MRPRKIMSGGEEACGTPNTYLSAGSSGDLQCVCVCLSYPWDLSALIFQSKKVCLFIYLFWTLFIPHFSFISSEMSTRYILELLFLFSLSIIFSLIFSLSFHVTFRNGFCKSFFQFTSKLFNLHLSFFKKINLYTFISRISF